MRRAIRFQLIALAALLALVMVFSGILGATDGEVYAPADSQVTEPAAGAPSEVAPIEASEPPAVSQVEPVPAGEEAAQPATAEQPAGSVQEKEAVGEPSRLDDAVPLPALQESPANGVVEALIYEDTNGNGLPDESPLNLMDGVTVSLYRLEGGGEVLVGSMVSGPGAYGPFGIFQPPPFGYAAGWVGWNQLQTTADGNDYVDYKLVMDPPPGYCATAGTTRVGRIWGQSLEHPFCWWRFFYDGEAFGLRECPELDGYKYADLNENQQRDPGEPGIAGVTIDLDGGGQSAVTDADGYFKFMVTAGKHSVTVDESTAPGYYPTTPITVEVEVPVAGKATVCFGNAPFGSISGHKYDDPDGNGELSEGDMPFGGVTIKLTGTTTFGEPVDLETVTAADGSYSFMNLKGGAYTITEVVPDGTAPTSDVTIDVTLSPGENLTGNDFFNRRTGGELDGYKFADLNENGVMDPGEVGLEGVTVDLDGGADSAVTDADGYFNFTVDPGTHTVTVDESTAPGYYPTTPVSVEVEVPDNGRQTVYFGNAPLGSISGHKWEDVNRTGILDAGDSPIAGWTIRLVGITNVGSEPVALETVTGADGGFEFEGLKAGEYSVSEVMQPDWDPVTPDAVEVSLAAGEPFDGIDFLNVRKGGLPPPPPPPPPEPPITPGTPTPSATPSGTLPFTGMNQAPYWIVAGIFILLGAGLLTAGFTRRRMSLGKA